MTLRSARKIKTKSSIPHSVRDDNALSPIPRRTKTKSRSLASLGMTAFFFDPSASLEMKTSGRRTFSLQRVGVVQRVALGGDESGVRDDAAEFAFVGAVAHAGGVDDIFFDQDAADVVGTELQSDLADFDSRRQPARLNVIDVVEIKAADGERFQIIDGGCFLHFFSESGVVGGKNPGDEGGESAGVFLNSANAVE